MALITPVSPSSGELSLNNRLSGEFIAAEDLLACAPCRIGADAKVYMANGAAADANAEIDGWSVRAAKAGQPITLVGPYNRFSYGVGLTPGNLLFLGATAGRLDTAASLGDTVGCALVVSETDIIIMRANGRRTA
ncbi:MAG TPA: hypothetical protein PLC98_15810 [Anaerolineales bacterium]|nr:hypothetical protein [Anaerolineales bacterium]